jgi:sec-independent protein translocase protein TatB
MFDFAWSEIALIGVVALVLIGPKDMPVAIKAVSDMVKKARKMAGEFQGHVDEMVKDTSIAEVRQQINEIRNFDIRGEIERSVDADGSLRSAFNTDAFVTPPPTPMPMPEEPMLDVTVPERPEHTIAAPDLVPATATPPAFIPPMVAAESPPAAPATVHPPAFFPPKVVAPNLDTPKLDTLAHVAAADATSVTQPGA